MTGHVLPVVRLFTGVSPPWLLPAPCNHFGEWILLLLLHPLWAHVGRCFCFVRVPEQLPLFQNFAGCGIAVRPVESMQVVAPPLQYLPQTCPGTLYMRLFAWRA